mgnify:CR=1 FL=1
MAKYEKHLTGNFDEVLNAVTDGVLNGSMSASYEDGSDWTNDTEKSSFSEITSTGAAKDFNRL